MGIENRDYYRQPPGRGGWGFDAAAPVCKYLIVANVVVFLLQIFVTRPMQPQDLRRFNERYGLSQEDLPAEQLPDVEDLPDLSGAPRVSLVQEWFQLDPDKVVYRGQVWRLLTCAFCHERSGVWHIFFNMLLLYWFGESLELMYGSREFLLFYLVAAVTASAAFVALAMITHDPTPAIGASGAVMAVMTLYAAHFPRTKIHVFYILPIEIRWLLAFYVIYDLHPVLLALAGDQVYTGVAHAAHLGGLAFGYVYWKRRIRLEPLWERISSLRPGLARGPRRRVRVYNPPADPDRVRPHDKLDDEVDALLEKILHSGEDSLTDRERDVLRAASDRYRNRLKG